MQDTPSFAYTQDCVSPLGSEDHQITPICCFYFQCTCIKIDYNQPALQKSYNSKLSKLYYHNCKFSQWWILSYYVACIPSTTSSTTTYKHSTSLAHSLPTSVCPHLLNRNVGVLLNDHSIMASNPMLILGWSKPPRVSPNLCSPPPPSRSLISHYHALNR